MALNASFFSWLVAKLTQLALAGALLTALASGSFEAAARDGSAQRVTPAASANAPDAATVVPLAELPAAGRAMFEAIGNGGPFAHDKDGSTFGNRERLLPAQQRGYYREYTVETPGARNRGARRIVCGGPQRTPVACWYTADHYASFKQIAR